MLGLGIGIAITITTMAFHAQDRKNNTQLRYEQQWERFGKMIEKRIMQLKRSCAKANTQHDIDSLKARIDKLEDAQIYLDQVQHSEEKYTLTRIGGDEGGLFFNKKQHAIGVRYVSRENFLHEMMHLWQYEKNKIAYDTVADKAILQDVEDEVEAYKVQFAYDPSSVQTLVDGTIITSLEEITAAWVLQIKKDKGKDPVFVYANHGRVSVDMDSRRPRLEKAYSFDRAVVSQLKEAFREDDSYRTVWVLNLKFKPQNMDLSSTKKIHRP